jgi:hypothetical protein
VETKPETYRRNLNTPGKAAAIRRALNLMEKTQLGVDSLERAADNRE